MEIEKPVSSDLYNCATITKSAKYLLDIENVIHSENSLIKIVKNFHYPKNGYDAYGVFTDTPVGKQIIIDPLFGDWILYHELGHIIEMNNYDRLLINDFGLKNLIKTKFSNNGVIAAFWRETKVRAIQTRIAEINPTIDSTTKSYFHNNYWFDDIYSRIENNPIGKFKTREDVIENTNEYFMKVYNDYTFDKIEYEWRLRLQFLKNWKEVFCN